MACPALGLEALQPLQPEPPPEPAFSEAQKWIEVGARGWWAAWLGLPGPTTPVSHPTDYKSSLASPGPFSCQLRWVALQGLRRAASPGALALKSRVRAGANAGHCSVAVRVGARKRSPAPPSLLSASRANLGSRRFPAQPREAQFEQKRRKGAGSMSPQSPCGRRISGVLPQVLPSAFWPPTLPFRSGFGSVSAEAHTHWGLWLRSWYRVRCEAGTAHWAREPARPTFERASSIDVVQPLTAPTPAQRGRAPRCRVPGRVGIFHFLNDSVAGQGNHWSSRLSPGSKR